jgi:hypothetical protein
MKHELRHIAADGGGAIADAPRIEGVGFPWLIGLNGTDAGAEGPGTWSKIGLRWTVVGPDEKPPDPNARRTPSGKVCRRWSVVPRRRAGLSR